MGAQKEQGRKKRMWIIPLILAAVQWSIWQAAGIGKGFMDYDPVRPYVWVQKGLFLLLLISAWCFAFYVADQLKTGNRLMKRGIRIFIVYFSVLFVILLILWPGTWYWDDVGVLASAKDYDVIAWQHFLSSFFQTVFLQLIPTPGGVILCQLVIAAIIVSYVITDYEETFCQGRQLIGIWPLDILIKIIPFLLPPVLLYQYSGFRMGMYIFYEVFVLGFMICISYRNRKIGWVMPVLIGLCTAVLSTWRSEGILYAPAVMLLLIIQNKEMLDIKKKLLTAGVMLMAMAAIVSYQRARTGNSDYSVVAILRPLSEVVRAADPEADADLLEDIEKVVGTQVMLDNPDVDGENLLWKYDLEIKEYSGEEYSRFMKAFVGLCMRHPKAAAKERIRVFIETSAIMGRTNPTNVVGAYYLFDPEEQNDNQAEFTGWNAPMNRPLSESVRQKFILFLGGLREDFSERITYRLIWNIILPLGVLVFFWVYLLVRKKWKMLIGVSAVVFRIPIVFLVAPATWTMYYLSFYLTGYLALMLSIVFILQNKAGDKAGNINGS